MRQGRVPAILGFVKVELRSRSPRLWGWDLYRDGNDSAVQRSSDFFRYAEDAWKAGQAALAELAPPAPRTQVPDRPRRAAHV